MNMGMKDACTDPIEPKIEVESARRRCQLDAWMSLSMTVPQIKCLLFIADKGKTTSGELAIAFGVTPTNVTGIVRQLANDGLVSRTVNQDNKRSFWLRATSEGQELLARLMQGKCAHR